MSADSPFRIGWASARANAVPTAVLWFLSAIAVLGYYRVPGVADALNPVAEWQIRWGVWGAVLNQMVFSGVVPTVFILTVKEIRTRHQLAKAALQIAWGGMWGALCWWFFSLQCRMFGPGHEFGTLVLKTAIDQFVWTVLVVSPLSALFYLWLGCDFSCGVVREKCRAGFWSHVVLPMLVTNWCVWIPVSFAVYAFPYALQIQVLGLVGALWTLFCRQIGRHVSAV